MIEPERRCLRLLLDGIEVYYDKCLIANSGEPTFHYHGHRGYELVKVLHQLAEALTAKRCNCLCRHFFISISPSPHPYSCLPTLGKPRDLKSALRVSGGVPRESGGIRAGRGAKGRMGGGQYLDV